MNYNSVNEIKSLLNDLNLAPQKKFGQNYLIDQNAKEIFLQDLPKKSPIIWEIGPGLGAMTTMLFSYCEKLVVFEIDKGYQKFLEKKFEKESFELILGDVVKTWKSQYEKEPCSIVVGNLPYNSASAIMMNFIEQSFLPKLFLITVQKEMAQRMVSLCNNKNYSAFSVFIQSFFHVKIIKHLPPSYFYPQPAVYSTMLKLEAKQDFDMTFFSIFKDLVKCSFSSKRKMLKNNLKPFMEKYNLHNIEEIFTQLNLNLNQRAEEISPQLFYTLASLFYKSINEGQ